jgi:hypothetical protein
MKKYLFGLSAIVLAIAAVAFTTPKLQPTEVIFRFTGSVFSEANVENPANWAEVSSLTCDDVDEKACRIKVDVAKTSGTAPNRTLISTTSIIASPHGSAPNITYFVTLAGDVLAKSNQLK